jgi:2'-phosphotransferase
VEKDEKNRFSLINEEGVWLIRANQGHSMQVQVEMTELIDPITIVHGTYFKPWELIKQTGLSRMNRQHIHFAVGRLGEDGVVSGMRKSCTVFIYVDCAKAMQDGIKFFKSENNVVLSSGVDGLILCKYFDRVEDKDGNLLEF